MIAEKELNNQQIISFTRSSGKTTVWCERGDVFYADLGRVNPNEPDCEQRGIRPVVIIQNDIGNKYSPTVIVAIITSQDKAKLPTHIALKAGTYGLTRDSVVTFEQIRTLDKRKLKDRVGHLGVEDIQKVNKAAKISLALEDETENNIRPDKTQIIKDKANELKGIDITIEILLDGNCTLESIEDVLVKRQECISNLERLCVKYNVKVENYYSVNMLGAVSNEKRRKQAV